MGLIGATKLIGSPEPKISTVEIPGSDVVLDFTEAFGGVHYSPRNIELTFLSLEPWSDQMQQDSSVKNALHGRKMNIVFSDDPSYYWIGRINVGDWQYYKGAGKIKVTIEAEPYKYKVTETIVTSSGNETVTLSNGRRAVVPSVSTDASITLAWDGYSISVDEGNDQIIPQLVLEEGDTEVEITGAASVSFKYQEGSL